jgi:hypothetical protein
VLIPFVVLSSLHAQYELPRYELPSEGHLDVYETNDSDDSDVYESRRRTGLIILAILLGILIIGMIGVIYLMRQLDHMYYS